MNDSKCDICKTSSHKMKVQYHRCNNPPCCIDCNHCLKRYVTYTCMLSDVEKLQKRQLLEVLDEKHNATQIVTKQRGLSQTVKDLIEELISEYE